MTSIISRSTGGQQAATHASPSRTSNESTHDSETPSPQPTSAQDPSFPITPPRGRATTRYPESLGRVPLHRRGTSRTYERLEDLLREAGYKETRVFTPETEHNANATSEKQGSRATSTVRDGMGAFVGFFAGLVSRNSSLAREILSPEDVSSSGVQRISGVESRASSPPPSSLAQTQRSNAVSPLGSSSLSSHSYNTSSDSLQTSKHRLQVDINRKRGHAPPTQVVQPYQSSHGLPHLSHSQIRCQGPYDSSNPSTLDLRNGTAHAYLRHMASAPNIHPSSKRPSSSSLRSQLYGHTYDRGIQRSRRTFVLNDEDSIAEYDRDYMYPDGNDINQELESRPPLPRNWIEAVAKAILSGGGGVMSETASAKTVSTRKTSTSALSDQTNQPRRRVGVKPPLLCAKVQVQRAKTSEGQVNCMRVTCRSAPTSRASSRVRVGIIEEPRKGTKRPDHLRRKGERGTLRADQRTKGKVKDPDIVPSLARTQAENDEWSPRHRYLSGWGIDATIQRDNPSSGEDNDDEDEDDEGELGLDRLLVPARRQHSIQSLRKHLQRPSAFARDHDLAPPGSPRRNVLRLYGAGSTAEQAEWPDASWGITQGRKWLTNEGDAEVEGEGCRYLFSSSNTGSSRRSAMKLRQGIPGPWAQGSTSS